MPEHRKFEFYFLELSEINIYIYIFPSLQLVETVSAEPVDAEPAVQRVRVKFI